MGAAEWLTAITLGGTALATLGRCVWMLGAIEAKITTLSEEVGHWRENMERHREHCDPDRDDLRQRVSRLEWQLGLISADDGEGG